MKAFLMCSIALSFVFSLGEAGLNSNQQSSLLDRHNYWRNKDTNGQDGPLTWDSKLQEVAQNYADKCIFAHNSARTSQSGYSSVGENIYYSSKQDLGDDLEMVVDAWDGEKKDYTLSSNECEPGKMCGHYTQVVWKNTEEVGCGIKSCSNIQNINKPGTIVVCDYTPAGNWVGQKPFELQTTRKSILEALLQMLMSEVQEEEAEIEMVGEPLVQQ